MADIYKIKIGEETHNLPFLPLSGGTLTGSLDIPSSRYVSLNSYGINLNNSDIVGLNSIYFADSAQDAHEGLNFARNNGNWDIISSYEGTPYYYPNCPLSTTSWDNAKIICHSGNISSYAAPISHTHDYLPLSGGVLKGSLWINPDDAAGSFMVYNDTDTYRLTHTWDGNTARFYNVKADGSSYGTLNLQGTVQINGSTPFTSSGGSFDKNANITFSGTGGINYKGTQQTYQMIGFLDNTSNTYGNGIRIGGGGTVVVGAGESSTGLIDNSIITDYNDEILHLAADGAINFYSNCDTIANRKSMTFKDGILTSLAITPASNNSYALGSSSAKWSNVYATTFNGDLSGTASLANGLVCRNLN